VLPVVLVPREAQEGAAVRERSALME